MIVDLTRLPNPVSSQHWRPIHHHVSIPVVVLAMSVTNILLGLQTPRLKRLAEIVSAQAIAQQEKLDYPEDDNNNLTDSELNGA